MMVSKIETIENRLVYYFEMNVTRVLILFKFLSFKA